MTIRFCLKIYLILIVSLTVLFPQVKLDELKSQTSAHMNAGRFGEAIDLLNKIVTAEPRKAENYYLRAKCFEKRAQYEKAVLDYRRAANLAESDKSASNDLRNKINRSLAEVTKIWYDELNKKIAGYMREIAIDPAKASNYLGIARSYKSMEKWIESEEWYDKYLARDDNASPDEIMRYTEVLAKNEHIKKGEEILKKFVARYPDDWRLWSKYGYFTMWLGRYDNAIKAFETALSFKPFFQEAMDGLDKAKKRPYVKDSDPRSFEKKEYPIDKFYRLVRTNPKDFKTRYQLIDELIKAKRLEEAYQQLQFLATNPGDSVKFNQKWSYVKGFRDSLYSSNVRNFEKKLIANPNDKDALKKLAENYEYLDNFDMAYDLVKKYFEANPNETDQELLFRYARLAAWIKDFDKAREIIEKLVEKYPDNLNYKLFNAQILVWTRQDFETADRLLTAVLKDRKNDIDALIAMGGLSIHRNEFGKAEEYYEKAKAIDPANADVIKLQSNIEFGKLRYEEEKLIARLDIGRDMFLEGNCKDALPYYEEYLDKAEPTDMFMKEYGDVNFCAENFTKALEIYGKLLEKGYEYDIAMQQAKVYFTMGDSVNAVNSFKKIVEQEPDDFDANLYLGDSYLKLQAYDSARAVYQEILKWDLDSVKIATVNLRQKWFPLSGFRAVLESFPNYLGFAPSGGFYADNLGFRYFDYGGRLEVGLTNFLAIGASFTRKHIANNDTTRILTSFKGHIFITFHRFLKGAIGFGKINTKDFTSKNEIEGYLNYEIKNYMGFTFNFMNSDAGAIMYSPRLVELPKRLEVDYFKLQGFYLYKKQWKITGYYQFLNISDKNKGNDLQLRAGYFMHPRWLLGYEFFYSNFRFITKQYYSPHNYESHSAWTEWEFIKNKINTITCGAKLGYVIRDKYLLREVFVKSLYTPKEGFSIEGLFTLGSTYRDDSAYNFVSGRLSLYWSF